MDCTPFCSAHRYSVSSPHLPHFSFLHHFYPLSPLFLVLLLLYLSAFSLLLGESFLLVLPFGKRSCLCNNEKVKGISRTSSSPPFPLFFPHPVPSLFPLGGMAVMFNQRDRDRMFHRDKVNRTARGLTKLLTPRQPNMNKRCGQFFFHGTVPL